MRLPAPRSHRMLRVAVLTVLAVLAVAACGTAGVSSSTTVSAAHTFVDAVPAVPFDLDETGTPGVASAALRASWASELVRPAGAAPGPNAVLPGDGAVVPYLATSWQRSAGGSYTFELRRGVRGDSGDPFTAADVRWSLERAIARSPVAPFLFSLAHIDTADPVTILSRHRVRVNVTSPSPFTLSVLASPDAAIYDAALYRAHAAAGDPWGQRWGGEHSASFGAYWVSLFVPGKEIVLRANPGFWRRPYYRRVVIEAVPSPSTRLADVIAGTATHTSGLTWTEFQDAVDSGGDSGVSATILQTGPAVIAWHLNTASGPLANPLVRQALNLGVDRVELARGIDEQYAAPQSVAIPAIFGAQQPANLDQQQARSLLLQAGYRPGALTLDVYVNDGLLNGDAAAVLGYLHHDMVNALGVNLNMIYVGNSDQLLALEQGSTLESTIDVQTPLLGGPGFLLEETANTALDPVSVAAQEHHSDPALTNLLDQLSRSPGGAATRSLIAQAAAAIDGSATTVYLASVPVQNVTRSNVTGYAAYTQPVTYYENLRPLRRRG